MKKYTVKKITVSEVTFSRIGFAETYNIIDFVIERKISYDAKTKSVIYNGIAFPSDILTDEEITENINSKTYDELKALYRQVEDCGAYFEVTEYEPTDYLVEIDGEVVNGVLHTSGSVKDGVLSL